MSDPILDAEQWRLHNQVEHDFTPHRPNPAQGEVMDLVRMWYKNLAHELVNHLPPGRDLSMALTDLETSQRCAIAAIAKNQEPYQ